MKTELEMELVKKYPKILKNYKGDPLQTCMCFGMECGDGWYKLLDDCMNKIQYFCDVCSKEGEEVQVVADQIKEKFGTLRFYISSYCSNDIQNDIIDDIVAEAERQSEHICEETGEMGSVCKRGGWLKCLCRKKARELGYVACDEETEKYWKSKDDKESNS